MAKDTDNLVCGNCGEPLQFVEGEKGRTWESTYEIYECECGMKWRLYLIADVKERKHVFDVIDGLRGEWDD